MEFGSKVKRSIITQLLINCIPDIIISACVVWWTGSEFWFFFLAFAGLQVCYLFIWIVRSAVGWAYFLLVGRKWLSTNLCDYLHINKYPPPSDHEDSAESYLNDVVNNKDIDVKTRIYAAHELGAFAAYKSSSQMQNLFRMKLAFEDAIEEYKRAFIRGTIKQKDDHLR